MGGVGKTSLALVLAHRLKERYHSAQLMLNLQGAHLPDGRPITPIEAMRLAIFAFHPDARLPDDPTLLTSIYRTTLSEAGRAILFFDNVANAEQLLPLLPPPGCLLIATSRSRVGIPGSIEYKVDCLNPSDSKAIIQKLAPRANNLAEEIADLCGHLPLALEIFAGIINAGSLTTVDELTLHLREKRQKLYEVEAVFETSYNLLPISLQADWRMLGIFPGTFSLDAASALLSKNAEDAKAAMQSLINSNLLEYSNETSHFSLHDLSKDFCRNKLSLHEKFECSLRHATFFAGLVEELDVKYLYGGEPALLALSIFDSERSNIEASWAWAIEMMEADEEARKLAAEIPNRAGHLLHLRMAPDVQVSWRRDQLSACRLCKDEAAGIRALGNLGLAFGYLGQHRKAIRILKRALRRAEKAERKLAQAQILGNLGISYAALGELTTAISCHQQYLSIAHEINDKYYICIALENLGHTKCLTQSIDAGISDLTSSYLIAKERNDIEGIAGTASYLAQAYIEKQDFKTGFCFNREAFEAATSIKNESLLLRTLTNTGKLAIGLHQLDIAQTSFDVAIQCANRAGDFRAEMDALYQLSIISRQKFRFSDSLKYLAEAANIAVSMGDRRWITKIDNAVAQAKVVALNAEIV